jgi:hypothetical protein
MANPQFVDRLVIHLDRLDPARSSGPETADRPYAGGIMRTI